jgi:zinc transport system substrate-binding protein
VGVAVGAPRRCDHGRRLWRLAAALIAAAEVGCAAGATPAAPEPGAGVRVVATVFPLAEVARLVGGARVTVTLVIPPGRQPRLAPVTPAEVAAVRAAGVVVDVGDGFQPELEGAAATAPVTVAALTTTGGDDPYVWLDPVLMQQVVARVAAGLQRADPAGAATYRQGARDLTASLIALDISFRSSLADCARHDIATSYPEFGRLASRYGLTVHAIAGLPPGGIVPPGQIARLARLIRSEGLTTVFDDPLSPLPEARALAAAAHVRVGTLDAIAALSAAEDKTNPTYLSLMGDDLARLRSALACDISD